MAAGKMSALSRFAEDMQKQYGDKRAGPAPRELVTVSTGVLSLDYSLRRGGWPMSHIVEIMGPPDTGKTFVVTKTMAELRRAFPGKGIAYIDMEKTFDYDWATVNGLDCSEEAETAGFWQHKHPMDSEDASDMARKCCMSGLFSGVIVDSVGGMESRKAFTGSKGELRDAESELVGRNAQVITRMVKHLAGLAWQTGTLVILVNQPRAVISSQGLPDQSAGPKAMQHATTVRVVMKKGSQQPFKMMFEEGENAKPEVVAVQVEARVTRSKVFPVGGTAEFWINNRDTEERGPAGLDMLEETVRIGLRTGAIIRNGSYYQVPGVPQFNGRPAMVAYLREHRDKLEVIKQRIFEEK